MIEIEKRLNAVMRAMVADDPATYDAAMEEIREYVESEQSVKRGGFSADADRYISDVLLELGVPEHLNGYRYLQTAINAVVKDPNLLSAITSVLYRGVAEAHDTSASRAERGIRHAIETCWGRIDFDTSFKYFGNTVSPTKGKPTNSEFIARVANIVRRRMKDAGGLTRNPCL